MPGEHLTALSWQKTSVSTASGYKSGPDYERRIDGAKNKNGRAQPQPHGGTAKCSRGGTGRRARF